MLRYMMRVHITQNNQCFFLKQNLFESKKCIFAEKTTWIKQ